MNKLALFDIDWTLLKPSKAHGLAFKEGFRHVYGVDTNHEGIIVHGWTDRKIIFETLRHAGLDEESIEAKLEDAMQFMSRYFAGIIDDYPLVVMPGAEELIKELYKKNVMIGVLTGNLESIAREKLKKVNLNKYFTIGCFGNISQRRADLAREGVKEAERYHIKIQDISIIGDTPLDISAGKEVGVKTIGVATGHYAEKDLLKAEPDLVVSNLQEIDSIKRIILR